MSRTPLIVNYPELFASLATAPLPAGVQSLGPALAQGKTESPPCEAWLKSLPIPRKEALLRVSAMREAAGNLWGAGSIRALEACEQQRKDKALEQKQEDLALQAFMAEVEPALASASTQETQGQTQQSVLLSRQLRLFIALSMEQDALEHQEALNKLFAAEGRLRQAIGDNAAQRAESNVDTDDLLDLLEEQDDMDFHDEEHAPVVPGNTAFSFAREDFSLPETATAPAMADILLALLPQDSCFFTCHAETCAQIAELEPEQAEEVTFPQGAGSAEPIAQDMRVTTGLLPGWKLAGFTTPPADAPWLSRLVRLYWKDGSA